MIKHGLLVESLIELIRRTSTALPADVSAVLAASRAQEKAGGLADLAMAYVAENARLAKENTLPLCQDTGLPTFFVTHPVGFDTLAFEEAARAAVAEATRLGILRQNSVDSLTGHNTGTGLGTGTPAFHFEAHRGPTFSVTLVLKGGGCENMGAQYALPIDIAGRRAGRDLAGVRAVVLDAVTCAGGRGCSPGFLGVCIGGDRAGGMEAAKRQFLRPLDDENPVPKLAQLEVQIVDDANRLGIGPMGFGGSFTLGGCKITAQNRVPACFFVSVAYMCWAFRRKGVRLDTDGRAVEWLHDGSGLIDESRGLEKALKSAPVKKLSLPLNESAVRALKVGDLVLLSGPLFTARDAVHRYLFEGGALEAIRNSVLFHCGPVVVEEKGGYRVLAAGPTTSLREEPYQAAIIERFGLRGVIGKGGMGEQTRRALQKHGAVYFHAIGGAAQVYAQCVEKVNSVHLLHYGSPEAVWELWVRDFPAIVTMDASGASLHKEVAEKSEAALKGLI
ncbi:MAG: FumA C-terminus/TtdB family hydratase beta subunit [Fibrobacterota bacterium]